MACDVQGVRIAKKHSAIITVVYPLYYPNLSPIIHAWVLLKRQPLIEYPDIGDTQGGPDAVKKLSEVLLKAWENIPDKHFKSLWHSKPDHIEAVTEAKGCYT